MHRVHIIVVYMTGQVEEVELSALDDDDALAQLSGYIAPQTLDDIAEARITSSDTLH